MAKNKINDLRDHLFEVIELLKCGEMDVETAKAVCLAGQTICNVTKMELDFIKNIGGDGTGFIQAVEDVRKLRGSDF